MQTCLDNCNAYYGEGSNYENFIGCSTACTYVYEDSQPANKLKKRQAAASEGLVTPASIIAANCPNDNCTDLFNLIDGFGAADSNIGLSEWLYYVNAYKNGSAAVLKAFQYYDANNDGMLSIAEAFGKASGYGF
jgi:hypothetical protein